jgi:glycosyltransferase involved in cell wall biosynthesis
VIRVCALTSGRHAPASRFRIRQHIAPLRDHGIQVRDYCPFVDQVMPLPRLLGGVRRRYLGPISAAWTGLGILARVPAVVASWRADIMWLERNFLAGLDALVRLTGSPRVLDVDDAIWLEGLGGWSVKTLARNVDVVIAGNQYLAEWFGQHCRRVHVIPTAIDCSRFAPAAGGDRDGDPFVIGWTGTSGNFHYLRQIQPALARLLRALPDAEIMIVADRPPRRPELRDLPVRFVPWSPSREVEALHRMDVGIMPLSDDGWARGKCSFKLLQYMAAGLPCVVTPIGMNAEILQQGPCGLAAATEDEWVEAVRFFHDDAEARRRYGGVGRAIAQQSYDVPIIARRLAELFTALIPGKRLMPEARF